MRVVHVDSAHEWRGSQNQVLLAAVGMSARGHRVTVACRSGGRLAARAAAAGLRVHPLTFGGDLSVTAILGMARLLRIEAPDVVHAHDPHAAGAAVLATRFCRGAHVVASRRVALPLCGRLSLRKYAACDRVVAVSAAVGRVLLRHGLPRRRLAIVHDGVPDRPAAARPHDVLRDLGVPPGSPVVGTVAALTAHKDHATLLAAMPSVLEVVPDAHLVIVGAGALRERLERLARERGRLDPSASVREVSTYWTGPSGSGTGMKTPPPASASAFIRPSSAGRLCGSITSNHTNEMLSFERIPTLHVTPPMLVRIKQPARRPTP